MNRKERRELEKPYREKQRQFVKEVIESPHLSVEMKQGLIDFIYYQKIEVIEPKCQPSAGALGEREDGK